MLKFSRTIVLIFILLLNLNYAKAQLNFNYTVSDGLASNTVFYVFQDSKNYLWFGTNQGVSRYNGQEFENFNTSNGLNNDEVFVINEDPDGNIYFGTRSSGLCYYRNDSIFTHKYNDILTERFPSKSVKLTLHWDEEKNMYLGDGIYNLIRISPEGDIVELGVKGKNVFDLGNTIITSIQRDLVKKPGFVGGVNKITFHTIQESDTVTISLYDTVINYSVIGSHYVQRDGENVMYVIIDQMLMGFDNGKITRKIMPFRTDCIFKDSKDQYWIGTREKGVFIFNSLEEFKPISNLLQGLTVTHVLEDFQGGIWCSTLEKGVFHFPSTDFDEKQYQGLPEEEIVDVIAKDQHSFFIRYKGGKNYFVENKDFLLFSVLDEGKYEEENVLFYDSIRNVVYTKDIIPGTQSKCPFKIERIPMFYEVDPMSTTFYYFVDPRGRIYDFRAMGIYSTKTASPQVLERASNIYNKVLCAVHFNDTNWVGTLNGLHYTDSNRLLKYNKRNISSFKISSIAVKENEMAFTQDGKGICIIRQNETTNLNFKKGTSSLKFNGCCYDKDGFLFFCNSESVFRYDGIKMYKTNNQQVVLRNITDVISLQDKLCVSSDRGLFVMKKTDFDQDIIPPVSHIKLKSINGTKIDNDSLRELDYDNNSIELEFTSIDFAQKSKPLFAWKMANIDEEWHYTKNPSLYLDRLSHGNYRILLKSSVIPTYWSQVVALEFKIKSPFWLTWWFFSISGLSAAGLILVVFILRSKELEKKANEQLKIMKEKNELENRALRAQMNPHFVFNTMTAIQNLIQSNQNERAEYFLIKFSHLMRLVVDKSQESHISLKDDLEQLISYMDLQNLRFRKKFNFSIELPEGLDTSTIIIPAMVIQPFVENAIEHGISKSDKKGELLIHFKIEDDKLLVKIEDNGIGRKRAKEMRSKFSKKHKSVGMSNVSNRLHILNGTSGGKNKVEVTDILDEHNNVCGTRVLITLKLEVK